MSENDKIPSRLTQQESSVGKQHPDDDNFNTINEKPYPNQEMSEGADNEQFIINNNSGGNPNSTESGHKTEWIDERKQNEHSVDDAPED
ncbi:hypothetical protein WG906_05415 [Pedobacter sp. P351]|uniref:hypothetical protein n=1 Tax=Pedobacter superstes TaxID=3133441 RepID=UPI00309F894D